MAIYITDEVGAVVVTSKFADSNAKHRDEKPVG